MLNRQHWSCLQNHTPPVHATSASPQQPRPPQPAEGQKQGARLPSTQPHILALLWQDPQLSHSTAGGTPHQGAQATSGIPSTSLALAPASGLLFQPPSERCPVKKLPSPLTSIHKFSPCDTLGTNMLYCHSVLPMRTLKPQFYR